MLPPLEAVREPPFDRAIVQDGAALLKMQNDRCLLLQVGCQVRFTLLVRMREDLQPYCEVMYFVAEHTGHVGADALPHHRRQRWLSQAAFDHVAHCLSFKLSTAEILCTNIQRIEREWLKVPSNAASGVVRRCVINRAAAKRPPCCATVLPKLSALLTHILTACLLLIQDFMRWLTSHPESQEARDAHLSRKDVYNIEERVLPNPYQLDKNQVGHDAGCCRSLQRSLHACDVVC